MLLCASKELTYPEGGASIRYLQTCADSRSAEVQKHKAQPCEVGWVGKNLLDSKFKPLSQNGTSNIDMRQVTHGLNVVQIVGKQFMTRLAIHEWQQDAILIAPRGCGCRPPPHPPRPRVSRFVIIRRQDTRDHGGVTTTSDRPRVDPNQPRRHASTVSPGQAEEGGPHHSARQELAAR